MDSTSTTDTSSGGPPIAAAEKQTHLDVSSKWTTVRDETHENKLMDRWHVFLYIATKKKYIDPLCISRLSGLDIDSSLFLVPQNASARIAEPVVDLRDGEIKLSFRIPDC